MLTISVSLMGVGFVRDLRTFGELWEKKGAILADRAHPIPFGPG
jgi:hypothetical protein